MGAIYKNDIPYSGSGGASLPTGGTTGQVLAKHSDTDGDAEWKSLSALGYREVATGTGTTYGQRAASLKTAFDALTFEEKLNSAILQGTGGQWVVYRIRETESGMFSRSVVHESTLGDETINLNTGTWYGYTGTTYKNYTEQAAENATKLVVIDSVGGGSTGETPTLEQVLTKGNSTTNNIYFDGSGNDDTSISGSGVYTSGTGTQGMRQVTYNQHQVSAVDNLVGTVTDIFKVDFDSEQVAMSDGIKDAFKTALGVQGATFVIDTANPCSYNELQNAISTPNVILIKHDGNVYPFVEKWESDENTKRYVNIVSLQRQGIDKGAVYFFFEAVIGDFDSPMAYSSSFAQPTGKPYTDSVVGNLAALTTTEKTNLVGAVNELKLGLDGLGEPFRVKQWGSNTLNVEIPYCTEDISNANIPKMVFSISDEEGVNYQIVGMLAYEVFDAASGGNRINCFPVCQFTGNGQKELSVRWACMGTTRKTAKRINAWVLLKHR